MTPKTVSVSALKAAMETDRLSKIKGALANIKVKGKNSSDKTDNPDESDEEVEAKGSKMLRVMDWAFDKSNGNIPGFGTSMEMAQKYLDKYGTPTAAINHLANWQITSAATAGFVTSLGGLATMPITLPANVAGVMAIQLRMIGAIAHMSGQKMESDEVKTGMYLCLLGSQAGDVLSKTASQFAVKFTTASLKKLPGTVLTKINKQVGFRLFTKFGNTGLVNINKMIPVLGGFVSGSVDAFSTYAIAKAAKTLFLGDIIEAEEQERKLIEVNKLAINMALANNDRDADTITYLKEMVNQSGVSEGAAAKLYAMIDKGSGIDVNFKLLAKDSLLQSVVISRILDVANRDGRMSIGEKMYLHSVCTEMGCSEELIKSLL